MLPDKITILKVSVTGAVSGYTSLWVQVNETVEFINLQVPIYFIFILAVVISLIGGIFSILTDTIHEVHKVKKLCVNFVMGLFVSFIVLPMFISEPQANLVLLTAFIASFSGMVLINILASAIHDKELQSEFGSSLKSLITRKLPSNRE